jgi:hypothetical protein
MTDGAAPIEAQGGRDLARERSMRHFALVAVVAAVAILYSSSTYAQTPNAKVIAAGADVGVIWPDDRLETAPTIDAFGEYYLRPRVSVRGMLAWASPGLKNRTEDHFRQVKLLFNGTYNWEGGRIHPFVTGGAGAYFVRLKREGNTDPDGETRGGINVGGGIEYFVGARTTIKGEGRLDIVSHPPGLTDATGFTLTIGLKRYF